MKKISVAIVGFGNIGRNLYEAVKISSDFELTAIVECYAMQFPKDVVVLKTVEQLSGVDIALLTLPSKLMMQAAQALLKKGISTVDCFDIHSEIVTNRVVLDKLAKQNNAVAITSAGWDPGSDSIMRCLFSAFAQNGVTYTNFGPGVSMGHTVCAKSKKGVVDALSITEPKGEGIHKRLVYVKLEEGANFDEVADSIKSDDYFKNDETHVYQTEDIDSIRSLDHGVKIERKAKSAKSYNQRFSYEMRVNNPALTAEIMTACARAVTKQKAGCYTMIEIAPVDFLALDIEDAIKEFV